MSTRSIESYVTEVCKYIDELDYKNINNIYETLQKMKSSVKNKHYLNYWKVLQCVGEVAADKLVYMVTSTFKMNTSDLRQHTSLQLLHVLELFDECLTTVAVIRRVNAHKKNVLRVVFWCLERNEHPHLVNKSLSILYRMIIAGKTSMVMPCMKRGIVRLIYQIIKSALGVLSLKTVTYCEKILAALLQLAESATRKTILKSNVVYELDVYMTKLQKIKIEWKGTDNAWEFYDRVKVLSVIEDLNKSFQDDWNPKERLMEELEQLDEVFIFCSSPSCRKQEMEKEKFLYCGKCRLSRYCCVECQKQHWKHGGHKEMCLHALETGQP
jgi:hypothetical protein